MFSGAVRLVAASAVALAAATAGCAAEGAGGAAGGEATATAKESGTRVFRADNGKITIPKDAKRVVATGYAVPALIEADAPLVGISTWKRGVPLMNPENLATYEGLEKVAGELASETNYEAIAEVRPDLIVIGVPAPALGDIDIARLESVAPVVAIGPTVPSAWRELSRRQADAAGASEQFAATKAAYDAKAAKLAEKYKGVLPQLKLAHVGAYGEIDKGNFQREFDGSWGTNIANDIGATYYGEVKEKGGGSRDVSEYPSIEELPTAFAQADALTYSVAADGSIPPPVRYAMDSDLWKGLPAVKAGRTYPVRYTEAATYEQAMQTLDALDKAFAPLLAP